MRNTPHNVLFQFFRDHIEAMHSFPEHIRKIFMVITMIFAATFVGLVSWLLFPPLQDVGLPSLHTDKQAINRFQAMDDLKQVVKDNEFANVIKIPEIGPASGFMQSFKPIQDLIVPKNLQDTPLKHIRASALWSPSWLMSLSHAPAGVVLKFREASALVLKKVTNILMYILHSILLFVSYVISYVLYVLSYLARLPSYISHVIDLLISSMSRTAI